MKRERARNNVLCWADDNDLSYAAIAGMEGHANVLRGEIERRVIF